MSVNDDVVESDGHADSMRGAPDCSRRTVLIPIGCQREHPADAVPGGVVVWLDLPAMATCEDAIRAWDTGRPAETEELLHHAVRLT